MFRGSKFRGSKICKNCIFLHRFREVRGAIIFSKAIRSVSAENGTGPMSTQDFIASMIQIVDHNLKSDQPEAVEKAEAGRIKRWLSQALKVRDDEPRPPQDG